MDSLVYVIPDVKSVKESYPEYGSSGIINGSFSSHFNENFLLTLERCQGSLKEFVSFSSKKPNLLIILTKTFDDGDIEK